ncbi:MAG: hypothetical protein K6C69_02185 [Lachnospiraceae bacterium]|nr:hypothetical protein [Lachnospiraceae bacterium]
MDSSSEKALQVQLHPELEDKFIQDHHRFIIGCIWHVTHRFTTNRDEEYSIALIALHEAIQTYQADAGPFQPFAKLVITRRLTDYLRKEQKKSFEVVASPDSMNSGYEDSDREDEDTPSNLLIRKKVHEASMNTFTANERKNALAAEIQEAQTLLASYGFSFMDLTESSPKSEKTKEACKKAIIALLRPGELYEELKKSGAVPMKALAKASGVPLKVLERHRRYIIASAEILAGDFPLLADYLDSIRKELRS